jgi:hypothetical protein
MQALHRFWPVWGLLTAAAVAAAPIELVRRVEKQLSILAGED